MAIDTRHPREIRADIRSGKITGVTAGLGEGHVQANLAVLPRDYAYDFLLFCQRNPRPCPLIEVTDVGSPEPVGAAPGADLRTDIPRYRIYKDGVLADEVTDVSAYWRDDLVAFLLGCSFTFEWALLEAGIRLWHVEHGKNVAMWRTSIPCRPAGVFHGPMVVSMRPIAAAHLSKAVTASARFPGAHGAPIHIGDPTAIGIRDLATPDWGDPQAFGPGDVPVFWACGVTPQAVALASKPPFMITHSPGHMFITDLPNSALAALKAVAVPPGGRSRGFCRVRRGDQHRDQRPGARPRVPHPAEGASGRRRAGAHLPRAAGVLRSARGRLRRPLRGHQRAAPTGHHGRAAALAPRRAALLLRGSRARLRSRGGGAARLAAGRRAREAPQRGGVPRLLHRLHAGPAVHDGDAGADPHPAARDAAHE